MARALTAEWTQVPPTGRDTALALWARRRDRLGAQGCHYWVFESPDEPGTFLEFAEGRDVASLAQARSDAGFTGATPILTEVELP